MANDLTPNEIAFRAKLVDAFAPKNGETRSAQEQKLYDDMLAKVDARLAMDGEATTSQIFAEIQAVANERLDELKALKAKNDQDVIIARGHLNKEGKTASVSVAGRAEMEAISSSLHNFVNSGRVDAISNAAHEANLAAGDGFSGLAVDYDANIITDVSYQKDYHDTTGKILLHTKEGFPQQGKLTKSFNFSKGVVGGNFNTFVVRDDLVKNDGIREYDTVDLIADAWLKKNPGRVTLPALSNVPDPEHPNRTVSVAAVTLEPTTSANRSHNRDLVELWIQEANHLHNVDWKACKLTGKDNPVIFPGQQLALPPGNKDIAPMQAYFHCTDCDIKVQDKSASIAVHEQATPAVIVGSTVMLPPPVRLAPSKPVEFAMQNTSSTNPKEYKQGSLDHALRLLSNSGLDPEFTYKSNIITDIATRNPAILSRETGETPGAHKQEGKFVIGDDDKSDDNNKRRNPTGHTDVENVLFGDRGHVYFPGELAAIRSKLEVAWLKEHNLDEKDLDKKSKKEKQEIGDHMMADLKAGKVKLPDVNDEIATAAFDAEDGKMVREDKLVGASAYGGKKYATKILGITVPIGGFFGRPVGYSIQRPDSQVALQSNAERWGVSSADVALSNLGRHGFNVMFRDEETQDTAPMTSPDRVYAYMNLLNSKKYFVESMEKIEAAKTPEAKQHAAEIAMTAWRDLRTNQLVRRVDSMAVPLDKSQEGLEHYLTSQGVDVGAIKTDLYDLNKNPHLQVSDMSVEQLHAQRDWSKNSSRFENIHPGQTNAAYNASQVALSTWRSQNEFELGMAMATQRDPDEKTVVSTTAKAIQGINHHADGSLNRESIHEQGQLIATNRNVQIATLQLLGDMHKNPENYFTKEELKAGADKKLFDRLLPEVKGDAKTPDAKDAKTARADVTIMGNTSPLQALPFASSMHLADEYFSTAKPEIGGPVVGKGIQKDPAAWEEVLRRASSTDYGHDNKGRSDGRRGAVSYLRAIGSQMTALEQAPDGSIRDGITPEGFRRINEKVDAGAKEVFHDAVQKTVIYGEAGARNVSVYGREKTDNVMAQAQRDGLDTNATFKNVTAESEMRQSQVLGLKDHPLLARDVVLMTVLKHPHALDGLEKAVSARGDVAFAGFEDMLKDVAKAQEKHPNNPQEAVKIYGEYFTRLEAKGDKRKGARMEHAFNDAIAAIARNPAMADAVVDAANTSGDQLKEAWLRAIPATAFADNGRETDFDRNSAKGRQIVGARDDHSYGDQAYASLFITLPTDAKTGKVDLHKGPLGLGTRSIIIDEEQAKNYNLAMTGKPFGAMVSTEAAHTKNGNLTIGNLQLDKNGKLLNADGKPLTADQLSQLNQNAQQLDANGKPLSSAHLDQNGQVLGAEGTVGATKLDKHGKPVHDKDAKNQVAGAAIDLLNANATVQTNLANAQNKVLAENLNLGTVTKGNAKLDNPVLILTKEEEKALDQAKVLDKGQKGAPHQLDAKAHILIDRALQNGGSLPQLNGQDLTNEQAVPLVKGLINANMLTLVRPTDLLNGKTAGGGFNLGRTGDVDTTLTDDQNHVGGVDKKWALAFLLLFKSSSTTITYITHHECAGCPPTQLPTTPGSQLPGVGAGR